MAAKTAKKMNGKANTRKPKPRRRARCLVPDVEVRTSTPERGGSQPGPRGHSLGVSLAVFHARA